MNNMQPSKESIMTWVQCYCWFYDLLSPGKKILFRQLLEELTEELKFVGVGVEISDEIKVAIGGWAVLLVLNRPLAINWYKHIERVSVYPGTALKTEKALGQLVDGVAYCQIHLAWKDVRDSATKASDNSNTIIHEFAHALDHINRDLNANLSGMLSKKEYEQWKNVFHQDYIHSKPEGLRKKLWDFFELGLWNKYNPEDSSCVDMAEFFAVSSEKFFETPLELKTITPDIYECLLMLYRFDPMLEMPKK